MKTQDPCPTCGEVPDKGVSEELYDLCQKYQASDSKEDRRVLAIEIAHLYDLTHDETSTEFTEDYHEYFESFRKARSDFEMQSLRLTRLAVCLTNEVGKDDVPADVSKHTTN